jgi:hypothetical protein
MTNSNRIKLTWISFFSYALTGALVIVTGMVMGNIADYFHLPVSSMSNTFTFLNAGILISIFLNAWLISMMQGIAESAQLAKTLGFTPDQLWSALEGGPLAAPYVKVKLDAIASEQFTPQMQLAHALKDARLALSLAEPHTMPGLENIAELWQQAADAGYAGEDLSAVYQWLSPSSKA